MSFPDYESYADYREALQRARQDEVAPEEEPDDEDDPRIDWEREER